MVSQSGTAAWLYTDDPCVPFPRAAPVRQPEYPQTDIRQSFHPANSLFFPQHLAQRNHEDHLPFAQPAPRLQHLMSKPTRMQTRPDFDERVVVPLTGTMPQTPPAKYQGPVQSTESSPERPTYFQIPSPVLYNPHLTALRPTWYREHHLSDLPPEMRVSATSREEYHPARNQMHESPPYGGPDHHLHDSGPGMSVSTSSREDYPHSPAPPVVNLPPSDTTRKQEGGRRVHREADVQYQHAAYEQRSPAPGSSSIPQERSHWQRLHSVNLQQNTQQPPRYNHSRYGSPATNTHNGQAYYPRTYHQTHPLPARPPPPSNNHDPIYQNYPSRLLPSLHNPHSPPSVLVSQPSRSAPAVNLAFPQSHPALSKNWRERPRRLQDQQQHRQSR